MKNRKTGFVECPVKLKTNTLNVEFDKEAFFDKYAIVSYTVGNNDGKVRNVSYERFLDVPYLSVFGCGDYWEGSFYTKFFVLIKRNEEQGVLECLSKVNNVRFRVDDLEDYDECQVNRIVVSLALNSLSGDFENSHRVFSNGILTVWNDDNFTIYKNKNNNPIVGLDITLNKYLNLNANTKSFWKVRDIEWVKKRWKDTKRLFKVIFTKEGNYTITPFSLKNFDKVDKEKDLYEEKSMGRNVVPFWPFSTQKYQSGKMVVLWNIVKQLNSQFKDILKVEFMEYPNLVLDKNLTKDETLSFIKDSLSGKRILIEDTVNTDFSKKYVENILKHLKKVYEYSEFIEKGESFDCKIQLLRDINDGSYIKGSDLMKQDFVTQHLLLERTDDGENEKDKAQKTNEIKPLKNNDPTLRRIMLELAIKHIAKNGRLEGKHVWSAKGWTFYKFKRVKGFKSEKDIVGAKLTVNEDGSLNYEDFNGDYNFNYFCKSQLIIKETKYIDSKNEYSAVEKNGNLYLIKRTEETPMMDVDKIDVCYDKIVTDAILLGNLLHEYEDLGATEYDIEKLVKYVAEKDFVKDGFIRVYDVANVKKFVKSTDPKLKDTNKKLFSISLKGQAIVPMFKREDIKEELLGGYQGIHTWTINGWNGEKGAFSYMVGSNSANLTLTENTVFDRVPHSHSVFPMRIANPATVEDDRIAILSMLSYGFGRWNEAMNYPFPFKFLTEHIERMCLENFKQHWNELKDLIEQKTN